MRPPRVYQQIIRLAIVLQDGADWETVRDRVKAALNRYINSLQINDDIVFAEMVRIVQSVPGVRDHTFMSPTVNVVFGDGELARVKSENIDVSGGS